MGGSVAIGARYADGEVVCFSGYTNYLTSWLKSARIVVNRDESVVRDFIKEHVSPNEIAPLSPMGYGLVFVDFKDGYFLSMQGFTGFESFSDIEASGLVSQDRGRNFKEFALAGRISSVRHDIVPLDNGEITNTAMINGEDDLNAILEIIRNRQSESIYERTTWFEFDIIFEPTMTLIDFGENGSESSHAFLAKLKEIGIPIDDGTQACWDEWIQEELNDEAFDAGVEEETED